MVLFQLGRLKYKMTAGDQLFLEMIASLVSNWKRGKLNKVFFLENAQNKLSELLLGKDFSFSKIPFSENNSLQSALTSENHAAYVVRVSPKTVNNFMETTGAATWSESSHKFWLELGSYFPFNFVPFPISLIFTLVDLLLFIIVLPFELLYYLIVFL